jgi:hypothetical protein
LQVFLLGQLMKYHRLSEQQFVSMHIEFSIFLAAKGIDEIKWTKIKKSNSSKFDLLLNNFSDLVWENILDRCNYIEFSDKNQLFLFHARTKIIYVIVIKVFKKNINIESINGWKWLINNINSNFVEIYRSSMKYSENRNFFLYKYLKKGAVISGGIKYEDIKTYFSDSLK